MENIIKEYNNFYKKNEEYYNNNYYFNNFRKEFNKYIIHDYDDYGLDEYVGIGEFLIPPNFIILFDKLFLLIHYNLNSIKI